MMQGTEFPYPKRDPFFSHRFVRLLQKSCAAMDIGQNACLLLCYIVHTEDAARYSAPVRFWNSQLMTVMGFKSPKQLNDCRNKAVEFGWLNYVRSGNRQVGKYFVMIPEGFEGLTDEIIEPNHSANHSEYGTNDGMNRERITERLGDGRRNESGTESGKPSNPIPKPKPNPKGAAVAAGYPDEFEEFWLAFPRGRKTKKPKALAAWRKALKKTDRQTILSAAKEYSKSDEGQGQYVQGPEPWLNGGRWEDDREAWKDRLSSNGKPSTNHEANAEQHRANQKAPITRVEMKARNA